MERFRKIYQQGTIDVVEIWVDTQTGVNYVFHFLFQPLQGKLNMPPDCAACPAALFSDFFLCQVLEVIQKDFLLRLFRQFGKSRRKGTAI